MSFASFHSGKKSSLVYDDDKKTSVYKSLGK